MYNFFLKISEKLRNILFFYHGFKDVFFYNCSNNKLIDRNLVDIVSIAFNNPLVIYNQIKLFKKNLIDKFNLTIVDNSSNNIQQKKIKELCYKYKISYIQLKNNPYNREKINPSKSHGLALNWVYYNYLKPRNAEYCGFVDHDIFPIRKTSIINLFKNNYILGLIQDRGEKWYLWPGFCFFKINFLKKIKINFMPSKGLDTGGQNYKVLFSKIDKNSLTFLNHKYEDFKQGKKIKKEAYELIGDWIHIYNASNWQNSENKDKLIELLLSNY